MFFSPSDPYNQNRNQYLAFGLLCVLMAVFGLLVVVILAVIVDRSKHIIVQGPFGNVKGIAVTVEGRVVHAFFGIPFAYPPMKDLRFRRPSPMLYYGDLDATKHHYYDCPQPVLDEHGFGAKWMHDEDCLHLDIWIPERCGVQNICINLTVLFFLSGNTFQHSDAGVDTFDGGLLAALGDVVVVTTRYRLGVLGFLYGGIDKAPGNVGLHDQLEAFRWVRRNIGYFGGNSSEINVVGHGSGASSIGYHLFSPSSTWKKEVKRFILMSESPLGR